MQPISRYYTGIFCNVNRRHLHPVQKKIYNDYISNIERVQMNEQKYKKQKI